MAAQVRALLERELIRNTFPSGIGREPASDYQCFIVELGFVAAVEAEASGHPLSQATWARLCALADSAAALVDERLRPPRQADSDEGRGLLLDAPTPNRWPSIAGPCRRAGRSAGLVATALGQRRSSIRRRPGREPSARSRAGPSSGLRASPTQESRYCARAESNEIWCRCDGGSHGYRQHRCARPRGCSVRRSALRGHRHPGRPRHSCYHGERAWRSYFRSTIAHNTAERGGRSQSGEGGSVHAGASCAYPRDRGTR